MSLLRHQQLLMSQSVHGGDPHFNDVELLLHMEDTISRVPPVFTDSSSNAYAPSSVGMGIERDFSVSRFGNASARSFQRNNPGAVTYTSGLITPPGTGDFCVECFYRSTTQSNFIYFISVGNTSANGFAFNTLTNGRLYVQKPGSHIQGSTIMSTNTWYHVAFSRIAGVSRLFVNGNLDASAVDATNYSSAGPVRILGTGDNVAPGWFDEFRYTVGSGRYSASFTPPAAPFPDF